MERSDRLAVVYLVVALAASLALGLAIAYLEVRRSQEMVQVELRWVGELERLQREVDRLREELLNVSRDLNQEINDKFQSASGRSGRPAAEDDGDDYYYDDYEGDDEEEGEPAESPGPRTRRAVRGSISPALNPYNLILRQPFKTHPNRTGPLEVKAKIIVNSEDNQAGYEIEKSSYGRPQGSYGAGNLAIHYVGDTTRIRHGRSHCYDMNHRMCHVDGIFREWIPSQWSSAFENSVTLRDGHFTLNKSPGIYYLYAQIFYADNHDTNGYRIYVNGHPTFQCTVTGLHDQRWIPHRVPYKKNSCYTAGLVQLNEGDRIMIKEIDNVERYSVFEPYKSYFGLFKIFGHQSDNRRKR